MPYIKRIREIAEGLTGILDRAEVLNSQLIDLSANGLDKLVCNFLSNRNMYTVRPFLFEIFIARWILSIDDVRDVRYEPEGFRNPPDFSFMINDKQFYVQAKAIIQIINEEVKKKIVKQINTRISFLTRNILEIWLSEDIEPKDLNSVVDWIVKKAVQMPIGKKEVYLANNSVLAWIKAVELSSHKGYVGFEHLGGTHDGLLSEINTDGIRKKVRQKMKQANKTFPKSGNDTFNLLALTYDFSMLISLYTFQNVLYGTEEIVCFFGESENNEFYERLKGNGIWSKRVFTNIDVMFCYSPGVDFLENVYDPYVFLNPFNVQKIRTIPEPFHGMKTHVPSLYYGGKRSDL